MFRSFDSLTVSLVNKFSPQLSFYESFQCPYAYAEFTVEILFDILMIIPLAYSLPLVSNTDDIKIYVLLNYAIFYITRLRYNKTVVTLYILGFSKLFNKNGS